MSEENQITETPKLSIEKQTVYEEENIIEIKDRLNKNNIYETKKSIENSETDNLKQKIDEMQKSLEKYEKNQDNLEILKKEQSDLYNNYMSLEKKYLELEELYKKECEKNNNININVESLTKKIFEKEEDIKYLKNQSLKSQNYFDENMEKIKKNHENEIKNLNENEIKILDQLKNIEDENKVYNFL